MKHIGTSSDYPRQEQLKESKKIISLKTKFDKIRKRNYSDALKFWEKNLDFQYIFYSWNQEKKWVDHYMSVPNFVVGDLSYPFQITIAPTNEDENELYNKWFLEQYSNTYCNIERANERVSQILSKSLYPKEYLQSEIKRLENPPRLTYLTRQDRTKELVRNYELKGELPDWRKENIETVKLIAETRSKAEFLSLLKVKLNELEIVNEKQNTKKLKWNCSSSILGFLITELADKGYIEYPKHKTEISQTGLAKLCYQIFEVNATEGTFIKSFNSKSNQLSDSKKAKFTIPQHSDIK